MRESAVALQQGLAAREIARDRRLYAAIGVATATFCTAVGAWVAIPLPFTPVPLTLQTFFVLLSGAMLGGRLGAMSQALYLALGAAGLPVFSRGGMGAAYLLGPTGGYLIGFVVASLFVGWMMSRRGRTGWVTGAAAMAFGAAIILILGATHLALVCRTGVEGALLLGVVPFLPGDAVKVAVACAIWRGSRDRVQTIFG